MINKLLKLANRLDDCGAYGEADELDSIIRVAAESENPEWLDMMTEEEVNDRAENIVMDLAGELQQAGYKVSADELFKIFEEVGADPELVAGEIDKKQQ